MTSALLVFNTNNFLPDIARRSFVAASTRWGVQYVEITSAISTRHFFWDKAFIGTSDYATPFDRVLQLDADTLVAPDCPSPFDLVPLGKFGVVSRVQPHRSGFRCHVRGWAKYYGVKPYTNGKQHLNAGFLLYEPKTHREFLGEWQSYAEPSSKRSKCSVPEQLVLSCLLAQTDLAHWLPWRFNACRSGWGGPVPGEDYIAHFHSPRRLPMEKIMRRFKWSR